jgi:hypothetical protein
MKILAQVQNYILKYETTFSGIHLGTKLRTQVLAYVSEKPTTGYRVPSTVNHAMPTQGRTSGKRDRRLARDGGRAPEVVRPPSPETVAAFGRRPCDSLRLVLARGAMPPGGGAELLRLRGRHRQVLRRVQVIRPSTKLCSGTGLPDFSW